MAISEYEQKAVDCLRLARVMRDNTNKALFHQMALAWIERANQIKTKNYHSESAASPETGLKHMTGVSRVPF